jgi:hypothetical protein
VLESFLAGAADALLFLGLGYQAGRRDKKQRQPAPEVCRCGHGPERHDKDGCRATANGAEVETWSYTVPSRPLSWKQVPCSCVRYVGPNTSYVPELEG